MLKNAILPLKTPFSGTLKMNNQYLTVARPQATYRNWVDSAIMQGDIKRQPQWTRSIAVGDKVYVKKVKV
jgi:hypothetical protein